MISINSSGDFLSALKNNFRRYAVLFAVFQLFAMLLSVLLISLSADYFIADNFSDEIMNITDAFSDQSLTLFSLFCSIEAFVLVAVLFRGLYSKRASDFYFSLPVKRGSWFNADFLFGVLNFAASYAIFCVFSIIAVHSDMFRKFRFVNLESGSFLKYVFMSFAALIVVYTVFIMCAVVSGRMWQYVLLSFISTFMLYAGVTGCICYLNTVYGLWINLKASYRISALSLAFGSISGFSAVRFFAAAALQLAVFYTAGYISFKKRKTEAAENKLSGKVLPVVLTTVCFLSVIFFCLGIGNEVSLYSRIIAAVIITVAAAVILSAVFFRKVVSKSVFASLFGAVILSAAVIFFVELLPERTYVNAVPEAEEIESVCVSNYGSAGSSGIADLLYGVGYLNVSDTDEKFEFISEEAKKKAVILHNKMLSDTTRNNIYSDSYYENGNISLQLGYKLKSGKIMKRLYSISTKDILQEYVSLLQTDEGMNLLRDFQMNAKDILFVASEFYSDNDIDNTYYESTVFFENIDYDKLFDCVKKDLQNAEAREFLYSTEINFDYWDIYESDSNYCIYFCAFSKTIPNSVKEKMKKLSPREMLAFEDEYMSQIKYDESWLEKKYFWIFDKNGYTATYLKELGYRF